MSSIRASGSYLTVGEMPGVTPAQAREFTDREHGQLNMVFQFEHVSLDQDGDKWTPRAVTVRDLRATLARWQWALGGSGWNSLYWSNHDQPRVVSRFGNDTTYWYESATALATVLHLHRGTPYVYQGEELGMTNVPFDDIDDFRDIESLNYFENATTTFGLDPATVLATVRQKSRDNARTPMQWTGEPGSGFSTGDAVDLGEPQSRLAQRRGPAGRPGLGLPLLPAPDRPAAHRAGRHRRRLRAHRRAPTPSTPSGAVSAGRAWRSTRTCPTQPSRSRASSSSSIGSCWGTIPRTSASPRCSRRGRSGPTGASGTRPAKPGYPRGTTAAAGPVFAWTTAKTGIPPSAAIRGRVAR